MQNDFTDICCMASSAEALDSYIKQDYCLVILDTQLSDMDSMEILRIMRRSKHTPILLLTNSVSSEGIVELLHAGADTYIEKPLSLEVCVAQANALIQLYIDAEINHNQHKPIVHGSELIISPRYRQVIVDGKEKKFTPKEYAMLAYFIKNHDRLLSREQLLNDLWGYDYYGDGRAVDTYIKKLRKLIAPLDYIKTIRKSGYIFSKGEH